MVSDATHTLHMQAQPKHAGSLASWWLRKQTVCTASAACYGGCTTICNMLRAQAILTSTAAHLLLQVPRAADSDCVLRAELLLSMR